MNLCLVYHFLPQPSRRPIVTGGVQDLESQGCEDTPLLTAAKGLSETLTFVHEVTEEELVAVTPEAAGESKEATGSSSEQDDDSEEECEFIDNECEQEEEENEDSGEECEFNE